MSRDNPEDRLQIQVKQHLSICLPPSILWTSSLAGVKLTMRTAVKAKAMGLQRGWPDLQFLFPGGQVRFIELKAGKGRLSPEQEDFQARTERHGVWALCRSVEEVDVQLRAWGAPMRNHPFGGGA